MNASIEDFYGLTETQGFGYPGHSPFPDASVSFKDNDAVNVIRSPISRLVALDIAALAAVPTDAYLDPRPQELAWAGETLIPRPAQWMNTEWALKPFVFVLRRQDPMRQNGQLRVYRCALHQRDGTLCNAELKVPIATYAELTVIGGSDGRPPLEPFETHLRDHHDIVKPMTCKSTWRTSLCDCGWECCDYYLTPCCFVGRLLYITDARSDDFVPHMTDGNACCYTDCPGGYVCFCWSLQLMFAPMLLVPCYPDWQVRSRVLRLRNIQENTCATWLTVWACAACSAMQVHRELRATGVRPGSFCCPLASEDSPSKASELITRDDVLRSRRPVDDKRNCTGTVVQRYGLVIQGTIMQ